MAGEPFFQRGRAYWSSGRVLTISEHAGMVTAGVRGTKSYEVRLWAERGDLGYDCTCPLGEDGTFCKHCVAVGLAWLAEANPAAHAAHIDRDHRHGWREPDTDTPLPTAGRSRVEVWNTPRAPRHTRTRLRSSVSSWQRRLVLVERVMQAEESAAGEAWPPGREVLYVIDASATLENGTLALEVASRRRKANGEWQTLRSCPIAGGRLDNLPDPSDRRILALLTGATTGCGYGPYSFWAPRAAVPHRYAVPVTMQDTLIPLLCHTGRLRLRVPHAEDVVLQWDDGPPWELHLEVERAPKAVSYAVAGALRRGQARLPLSDPVLLLSSGFVFHDGRCGRLEHFGAFAWISHLLRGGPVTVRPGHADALLTALLRLPHLPRLVLPEELRFEEVAGAPTPRLVIRAPSRDRAGRYLRGELSFDYNGTAVGAGDRSRGVFRLQERLLLLRDPVAEQQQMSCLHQLGFRQRSDGSAHCAGEGPILELAPGRLPRAVRELVREGWHVEAEGRLYRHSGAFRIDVTSGVDWFELHGAVEFGDLTAPLPAVLAALRRGESLVRLGDGTYGVLPEAWLAKYGLLAGLGTPENGHLRFARSQVGVLDALLASQPQATWDEAFARARDELRRFSGIASVDPPLGFVGVLRGYQREGLGWLQFLQQFGFGGCLADDMGLGKTVQVLALLASRCGLAKRPSLVVVPRSLVFNWKQEAARFTPALRVLDHTGLGRGSPGKFFRQYDVILTTYGTLRRDITKFTGIEFDYIVLDEAQAIKNASTNTAKAARLLRGAHRLVLSGTPVENHLGELWSLFEFLNPGMLGAAPALRLCGVEGRTPSAETRMFLARALRPFILRRTKEQVLRELPPKHEQALYCELEPRQREVYDELRKHYRRTLLGRIEREGLNQARFFVLEALLRLRQAACHPGLIDRSRRDEPSTKLDVLLPRLTEVIEEGHKALVFSQFTTLLGIVRDRLDRSGMPYEYLDGRTRNRAARVRRFEEDADCRLFLVSLKAGGLGLNLTAADYVFLLDPWWNPAAEAQAIDRTHRIGQTRRVFAYRLIARDTVEEKVLAFQQTKRELADAIITADNSLVRALRREDLEVLLS
jgi:superfamily II DNA or RNA helicase